MTERLLYVYAGLVGACVGSFLNVCVARWPREQSVVRPRSRCPRCARELAWYENVPLVSWLALRGRCLGCRTPISAAYPLGELVVALIWVAAAMQYGLSFTALRVAVFATLLLGIMLTDAGHYVIPDGFTVFGFCWAIVSSFTGMLLGETLPFVGLYDAFIGACVGAGAIAIAGWLGEVVLKREAMGFGDVTLMAMAGAHLGPTRALLAVFLGALLGGTTFLLIVFPIEWVRSRRRGEPFDPPLVPFGVFLAPAAMMALVWGNAMLDWYVHGVLGL